MITKVTAEVVRKMPLGPIECVVEYIVNTPDASAALDYVKDRLAEGGWEYISITAHTTWLHELEYKSKEND